MDPHVERHRSCWAGRGPAQLDLDQRRSCRRTVLVFHLKESEDPHPASVSACVCGAFLFPLLGEPSWGHGLRDKLLRAPQPAFKAAGPVPALQALRRSHCFPISLLRQGCLCWPGRPGFPRESLSFPSPVYLQLPKLDFPLSMSLNPGVLNLSVTQSFARAQAQGVS